MLANLQLLWWPCIKLLPAAQVLLSCFILLRFISVLSVFFNCVTGVCWSRSAENIHSHTQT